jgi:hypothetical protein
MECNAYLHKFKNDRGMNIFVPSPTGRLQGEKIIRVVLKRWTPPRHFFHFQKGGHVAASLIQLSSTAFARLDIKAFFDAVTRTKVHRALRRIGISQRDALAIAMCSTVRKPGAKQFSLPFGYVQSPVLASVVLDSSALGAALRAAEANISLAVYVDDILMSAGTEAQLAPHVAALDTAARLSGFELHPYKRQFGSIVEAFNLQITNKSACVTDERMAEWLHAERSPSNLREWAIVRYVRGINPAQADVLEEAFGLT